MNWPQLLYDQNDLQRICTPAPPFAGEYHTANELYGHAAILREYSELPNHKRLPFSLSHFVSFDDETPYPEDAKSRLPMHLSVTERESEILREHGREKAVPIGFVGLYAQKLFHRRHPDRLSIDRKGTIVFPDKCTVDKEVMYDREKHAAELAALPDEFQPVFVSIFWKDYLNGFHHPFLNAGLRVVSSGHSWDPEFHYRQYDLCRQFRYSCSNDISTSFCASVLAGCRFFFLPSGRMKITKGGQTRTHEEEPTLRLPTKRECLSCSTYPEFEDGKIRSLASRFAGSEFLRTPEEIREFADQSEDLIRNRLAASRLRFEPTPEPDRFAGWLPYGVDLDGWTRNQCGLSLAPARGESAIRIHLWRRPIGDSKDARLTVTVQNRELGTVQVFPGRSTLTVRVPDGDPVVDVDLRSRWSDPLPSGRRKRSFRILKLERRKRRWYRPRPVLSCRRYLRG